MGDTVNYYKNFVLLFYCKSIKPTDETSLKLHIDFYEKLSKKHL